MYVIVLGPLQPAAGLTVVTVSHHRPKRMLKKEQRPVDLE
jgi:ACT domain-containing protein